VVKLKLSLGMSYGCHHDFVNRYGIPVYEMTMTLLTVTEYPCTK